MSRENKDLVVGLDIGTSKIVALVAEINQEGNLNVIGIFSLPIISQGCTKTAAPNSCAASKTGNNSGALRFQSFTCEPICTPRKPIFMQRSSSLIANAGDCKGIVPKPIKRFG